jgi:O-antigen/teichoic acid export membrane protein
MPVGGWVIRQWQTVQSLRDRPYLRKVLGNTGWLFSDRIARMVLGVLVASLTARYLGPERFGQFAYAAAFVGLFAPVAMLGLDGIVVRNLVARPEARNELLGTTFWLKAAGSLVVGSAAVGAGWLMRPHDGVFLWLVAVTALGLLVQAFDTIDFWFQAEVASWRTVVARSGAFLAMSAAKLGLIALHAPLVAFAWANTIETAIAGLGMVVAYRWYGGRMSAWTPRWAVVRDLLRDSWPLILSSVAVVVYMRIDQVMLGSMATQREVGTYAAAVRLAEAWYFVPMAICSSVFPSIVAARGVSEDLYYSRLQRLYGLMAFAAYAVALPTTFLAGPVIHWFYGDAYRGAAPMLAVLIWAGLFTNLGVARSSFLMAENWGRVHLGTVIAGAVINVILNLWWIPRYGGMGAVWASCVAYWFAAHGSCYCYPPLVRTGNMLTKAMLWPRWR